MKILVTGGAGFIGYHLVKKLIQGGNQVIILDDLSSGQKDNILDNCHYIDGSILDIAHIKQAFQGIDLCYHLAAIPSVQKSIQEWLPSHNVNLTGTINVFHEAAHHKIPVIYASSAAVYGPPHHLPIGETHPIGALSPYGIDKYCSELQARAFANIHEVSSIGLRLFNVYGDRQNPKSEYSGVISIFMDRITSGQDVNLFGDGMQERDFIHVSDVVNAFILAKNKLFNNHGKTYSAVYNICTGVGITLNSLINIISDNANTTPQIRLMDARVGDIYKSIGDAKFAEQELGFKAQITIQDGISNLLHKS